MMIPRATYRIQFTPKYAFSDAMKILDYLSGLGISHIYASPVLRSRKGSDHGYDMVDPEQIDPELGGEDGFEELARSVREHGMFWLQDIVPNHMAFDTENNMLMDVFENGEHSPYRDYFDIEWKHIYSNMRGRVLAPFLGKFYSECLESGEIRLQYAENGLSINYYSLKFPLKIESYAAVFERNLEKLDQDSGKDNPDFMKYIGNLNLTKNVNQNKESRAEQIKHFKKMMWGLYTESGAVRSFIDGNITELNGKQGDRGSYNELDKLLSEQYYRLSFWKVASEEINYRRFFTVNDLISMRVEKQDVFDRMHVKIFEQIEKGNIHGLRIDHIDGLFDPDTYLNNLRGKNKDIYIVVEKILGYDEDLPPEWEVHGTTGYDILNFMNGLFCNGRNQRIFTSLYSKFAEIIPRYEEVVFNRKRLIIGKHMAGNIDNLAQALKNISGSDRYGTDITLYGLKRAFVDVMALFPVYRTYITQGRYSEQDRKYIIQAIELSKQKNPGLLYELNFIEKFLLMKFDDNVSEEEKAKYIQFIMNFQQYTGPIMAKGLEDTVFYLYNRLVSMNEVGADPVRFGVSRAEFTDFVKRRNGRWKHSLNATATHDTKRGEDVRARLNVLSEMPREFYRRIKTWAKLNKNKKTVLKGIPAPDKNDEYLIYQTLLGTYPFDHEDDYTERIKQYVIKAVRESKEHTAWIKPDTDYEDACTTFVEKLLDASRGNAFLDDFLPFQKKISELGIYNSLSQAALKIMLPGVPDFYQGTELWDLSLVDPDNRRPVDYAKRIGYLEDIKRRRIENNGGLLAELLASKNDGRIKLLLVYAALQFRKDNPGLFGEGSYVPVQVVGKKKDNLFAFARHKDGEWALCVVPRLPVSLLGSAEKIDGNVWDDTYIKLPESAPRRWNNVITANFIESENSALYIKNVLAEFPAGLLYSK
ncbi:MAG: malto-oligosyltrehalose synthase [Elusimicrobiota bacterium]